MTISQTEFLTLTKLDRATLEVWLDEEWLLPLENQDQPSFTEADLARAALIGELQRDFGVNLEGIGLILNLLDQVHSLRKALACVRPHIG